MKNKKNFCKIIIIIVALGYVVMTFINQQQTLNKYKAQETELAKKIEEKEEYKNELISTKENVDSLDFIEETAREKLDMYLPNERVYIDQEK